MNEKAAKFIRTITLPPLMALLMIGILWNQYPSGHAWLAILFMTVYPLLPYPLQKLSPRLSAGGRREQRRMAVIFSVIGYIAGLILCLSTQASRTEWMVYLCYAFSAVLIAVSSRFLKVRSSGHAAGVAGPVSILVLRASPWYAFAYLLLIPVYYSSLRLHRHTLGELLWGTAYPIIACIALQCLLP